MRRERAQRLTLLLVAALLVATLAAASWMRQAAVGSWLGYLPREHQVFVVTGDLATLWTALDDHFGTAVRDTGRQGWLASLAAALDEPFAEAGAPIHGVADFERHGFDVSRGAAWSFGLPGRAEPAVFLIFPVADRERMLEWFQLLHDGPPRATHAITLATGDVEVLELEDDTWLAFPRPDVAVVTDSRALLERSIRHHDAGMRWWRNNDALVEALAGLRGPGGRAVVHWRHDAPPLETATALLALGPDTVRITVTARLARGGLQIVEDLLRDTASGPAGPGGAPAEAAALLVVDDAAISRYLRFAGRFAGAARFMRERYGGILAALRDTAGLERVSVAVTGYRDGLPEIVLALDGDAAALERVVKRQQLRLAGQRDRRVLEGALAAWQARGRPGSVATVERLGQEGLLAPDPALRDYDFEGGAGGVAVTGAPSSERFAGAAYRRDVGGYAVRYLAPPRNANDVRYLLDPEDPEDPDDGAPIDTAAFVDDRYRLATSLVGGRLLVATDASALETPFGERTTQEPPLWDALRRSAAGDKAWVGIDVGRLVELGLLTPEPDVQEFVRHYLLDFSAHPAAFARLRADPSAGAVRVELTLARGQALGRPR